MASRKETARMAYGKDDERKKEDRAATTESKKENSGNKEKEAKAVEANGDLEKLLEDRLFRRRSTRLHPWRPQRMEWDRRLKTSPTPSTRAYIGGSKQGGKLKKTKRIRTWTIRPKEGGDMGTWTRPTAQKDDRRARAAAVG